MVYRLDLDMGKMYKLVRASCKRLTGSDFPRWKECEFVRRGDHYLLISAVAIASLGWANGLIVLTVSGKLGEGRITWKPVDDGKGCVPGYQVFPYSRFLVSAET